MDLEYMRALLLEKQKELKISVAKVEALTRQLEELQSGVNNCSTNFRAPFLSSHPNQSQPAVHLKIISRLTDQQNQQLIQRRKLLSQRRCEITGIDERIKELQQRLTKKRMLNQQLSLQLAARNNVLNRNISFDSHEPNSESPAIINNSRLPSTVPYYPYLKNSNNHNDAISAVPHSSPNSNSLPYSSYSRVTSNGYHNANHHRFFAKSSRPDIQKTSEHNQDNLRNDVNYPLETDVILSSVPSSSPNNSLTYSPYSGVTSNGYHHSNHHHQYSEKNDQLDNQKNSDNNHENSRIESNYPSETDSISPSVPRSSPSNSAPYPPFPMIIRVQSNGFHYPKNQYYISKSTRPENQKNLENNFEEQRNGVNYSETNNSPNDSDSYKQDEVDDVRVVKDTVNQSLIYEDRYPNIDGKKERNWYSIKRRPMIANNDIEKELDDLKSETTIPCDSVMCQNQNPEVLDKDNEIGRNSASNSTTSEEENETPSPHHQRQGIETFSESSEDDFKEKNVKSPAPTSERSDNTEGKTRSLLKKECVPTGKEHEGLKRKVSFDPVALLLDAALEGELELIKKTAAQIPDLSVASDEGITALHNTICAGHLDIVKYLVEIGSDVNSPDSDGWTPLHCAASCNNLQMVKYLVEHGACIFATTFSDCETAVEKCEEGEEGYSECFQYLMNVQENLGIVNNGVVYAVYDYEAQSPDELSFKNGDAMTVIRRGDDDERDWWWARLNDKEGYVPRNLLGLYPRAKVSKNRTDKIG